jgi:hypothetical protein
MSGLPLQRKEPAVAANAQAPTQENPGQECVQSRCWECAVHYTAFQIACLRPTRPYTKGLAALLFATPALLLPALDAAASTAYFVTLGAQRRPFSGMQSTTKPPNGGLNTAVTDQAPQKPRVMTGCWCTAAGLWLHTAARGVQQHSTARQLGLHICSYNRTAHTSLQPHRYEDMYCGNTLSMHMLKRLRLQPVLGQSTNSMLAPHAAPSNTQPAALTEVLQTAACKAVPSLCLRPTGCGALIRRGQLSKRCAGDRVSVDNCMSHLQLPAAQKACMATAQG